MKTTRKLNLSFGCSVFAIMLSFAMLLSLLVAGDKADQLSFISAIAAFIGISVTLVVGYQIYNAVELKQKINAVEKLKIAIEQQQKRLKSLEIEQKEGFEIIQSRVFRNARMYIDAFIHIHAAIVYSLSVNHTSDGVSWLMKDLKFCMLGITSLSFRRCFKEYEEYDFPNKIAELRKIFQDDKNKIINHPNFGYIKNDYEELMSKFEKRLDNIAKSKEVSLYEIDGLAEYKN